MAEKALVEPATNVRKLTVFLRLANLRGKGPTPPAASRVRMELDRSFYMNRTRTKEMRKPIQGWSFPDSGAQVCMIPPNIMTAMGRSGLVVASSLQINDAGGHIPPVDGEFYF